jgi:ferric-dicitrate binding protein FerR (iron transport regulator)
MVILAAASAAAIFAGCGSRSDTTSPASPGSAVPDPSVQAASPVIPVPSEQPVTEQPATSVSGSAAAGSPVESPASEAAKTPAYRIGEIVYVEGAVLLQRGGMASLAADIGQVVENFDVVVTGARSRATVELDSGKPGGAEIRLAENTVFYYESALSDSGARDTVLQLLAGAIALKVEKLADGEFRVGTDGTVLGVRGTTFIVNTVPDGALLVTCAEGRVEVTDDSGRRLYAQSGRAVVQKSGEAMAEEPVSVEKLGDYRIAWVDENMRSLEGHALQSLSGYAKRYTLALPKFEAAYAKLREQAATLAEWDAAREAGREPRLTDWIVEKKTVAPVLFDCLSALFELERPFYRIEEFAPLQTQGIGVGILPDGQTTAQFFEAYESNRVAVAEGLSWVRRALLLFKYASADSPLGQFFGSKADALGAGAMFVQ